MQLQVSAIGTLKVALKSRTVDPNRSAARFVQPPPKVKAVTEAHFTTEKPCETPRQHQPPTRMAVHAATTYLLLVTAVAAVASPYETRSHSSHLKLMTMYGGTADQLHAIEANVLRSSVSACANKTITEDWKMKILIQLSDTVFDRSKHSLHAEWQAATDTFIASVKPHVATGKALGVFMGDEICCGETPTFGHHPTHHRNMISRGVCDRLRIWSCTGGTPYSNLSSVAARLKAGLPSAWIYTNECVL